MKASSLKLPSAWIPIAMSFTALTLVLVHVALYGAARQADEGPTAHLFQLLMAAQLPLIAYFAIRWLPQSPSRAVQVLALQFVAAVAALSPVYFLHL
jgi:hypothetical protein